MQIIDYLDFFLTISIDATVVPSVTVCGAIRPIVPSNVRDIHSISLFTSFLSI